MKICLVYPPVKIATTSSRPPMGLAYLASTLVKRGAQVNIVSSGAEGLDVNRTVSRILDLSPDLVGISVLTTMTSSSLKIIEGVKRTADKIKVMAGGPHPTLFPEEFLERDADFVIRGEGERTLSELYNHFDQGLSLGDIRGLSYKENGHFVHNPDRELIGDLDILPFPAWELFPIRRYKSDFRRNRFSLPILSSRGCPAQCTFCYKAIFGDELRLRDPDCIVEEIAYLKDRFKIEEFAIIDDSFTSDPKTAMEVCEGIISRKIGLPWTLPSGIRVPTVSKELLKKLKAAGCYRVALGLESGSQRILDSVKKGITLKQAREAVGLLKEFRIESVGYFMIGNPEETEQTVEQTINFAIELDPDYAQFSKATPFPGTAMYEQLKKEDKIIANSWDDYDCFLKSAPVFIHKNLSSEKIDYKFRQAYKRFFYRPKCILKHLRSISSFRGAANFIKMVYKFFKTYTA